MVKVEVVAATFVTVDDVPVTVLVFLVVTVLLFVAMISTSTLSTVSRLAMLEIEN